jgi:hypothetical protein
MAPLALLEPLKYLYSLLQSNYALSRVETAEWRPIFYGCQVKKLFMARVIKAGANFMRILSPSFFCWASANSALLSN